MVVDENDESRDKDLLVVGEVCTGDKQPKSTTRGVPTVVSSKDLQLMTNKMAANMGQKVVQQS